MSSQMTASKRDKKLQELAEDKKHLIAQLKYHNYIIKEYSQLRKDKLEALEKMKIELCNLEDDYQNAPIKIVYLQKKLEKNKKNLHTTKDCEGKIRRFLRLKKQLDELQMELQHVFKS